jgi:hypothetical protein
MATSPEISKRTVPAKDLHPLYQEGPRRKRRFAAFCFAIHRIVDVCFERVAARPL